MTPGAEGYDEEQSARNFQRIQRLVVPGAPTESVLLMNPLTEEAGGSHWHAGGKHWTSQTDPEWALTFCVVTIRTTRSFHVLLAS